MGWSQALARTRAVPNRGLDFSARCSRLLSQGRQAPEKRHFSPRSKTRLPTRHQPCRDRGRGAVVGTPVPVRRPGFPPSGRPPADVRERRVRPHSLRCHSHLAAYMDGLLAALRADERLVVRLEADPVVLRRRIVEREPPSWSGSRRCWRQPPKSQPRAACSQRWKESFPPWRPRRSKSRIRCGGCVPTSSGGPISPNPPRSTPCAPETRR